MSAGKCGLSFGVISYCDFFMLTCTADKAIMENPSILINFVQNNLTKCIENAKTLDLPSTNEKKEK